MANRERGEMRLATHDAEYTLKLTTNACCELEDRSGLLFDDVIASVNKGSVRAVRWLLWAALQEHHSEAVKDVKAVGPIIDGAGGLGGVLTQMSTFLTLNADESTDATAKANGAGTRPPVAEAVSGVGSTLTPATSASTPTGSGAARFGNSGANSTRRAGGSKVRAIGT